ncbi:zinc-dependent alcohol dehydrogenase [Salipiger mangrovisoli]|uniref:Alcohol dehydrogenase catalytic domain-containing protein n=1 Tax=Salipiger mangrovisoli TaxID=2865933 RepID=A0ABR9X4W3_9RHOB|nr:alcohol dehydrogenase catalytic domain-containing protein [Salipiger mangrovisoli]MBE9638635.1 alcohol dehydrogenase catalytic domain-containing protein [Salipiger mangrovisoli]
MLALQKTAAAPGLELREVTAPPVPGPGEVLLAIEATGVCGTDVHIAHWTPGYESMQQAMPVTIGHETCGRVESLGAGVDPALHGRRVTVRPSVLCHSCAACLGGDPDNCTGRRGVGIGRNGAFAPQLLVPAENCVMVPDALDAEIAALTEPMTVCREAVDTAALKPGARVLVLGPGTIGQGIALFAEAAGAGEVVVLGRDDASRLAQLDALGFPQTADTLGRTLAEALVPWLDKGRFDVIFEATGAPSVVPEALSVLAKRGRLVIVGIHPAPAQVDLTALVRNHQQILGSYRAPVETWPEVLGWLEANAERARGMISHRLPLAAALDAVEIAGAKQASKVMVLQGGA